MGRTNEDEQTDDITIYDDDIDMWLEQFKEEQSIDDYRTISQNVWHAALMYVRKHVFPDRAVFKSKKLIAGVSCMPTTFGAYDYYDNCVC